MNPSIPFPSQNNIVVLVRSTKMTGTWVDPKGRVLGLAYIH